VTRGRIALLCAVAGITVAGANLAIYAVERDCIPDAYGYSDPCTGAGVDILRHHRRLLARRHLPCRPARGNRPVRLCVHGVDAVARPRCLLAPLASVRPLVGRRTLRGVILRSCRRNHGARHRPPHGWRRLRDAGLNPGASPKAAAACCLSANVSSRSDTRRSKKWTPSSASALHRRPSWPMVTSRSRIPG
jgi:hypothetical protein